MKPAQTTLDEVCACALQRPDNENVNPRRINECAGPHAIAYMTEYARTRLKENLERQGLTGEQREAYARCFGEVFWQMTADFASASQQPKSNDVAKLNSICHSRAVGGSK
jgi:hypothetical protein